MGKPDRTGQSRKMTDRLTAALVALRDSDLEVLRQFATETHGPTAGLLAAIEHAAHWEYHRRGGSDFEMLPLGEAVEQLEGG